MNHQFIRFEREPGQGTGGENNDRLPLDMTGKQIESGHIVAVRYVWNSYVGVARMRGLCAESKSKYKAFFGPHPYSNSATYQILGHIDSSHKDFNESVCKWYNSDDKKCPVNITVYH